MKKINDNLLLSVDMFLHLNDLTRHCDKNTVSYDDAVSMGLRFGHTFYDEPIYLKRKPENYDYLTRLKMFNVQL